MALGIFFEMLIFNKVLTLNYGSVSVSKKMMYFVNVVIFISVMLLNIFIQLPYIMTIICFIIYSLLTLLYYGNLLKKLFTIVILIMVGILLEIITGISISAITGKTMSETLNNTGYYIIGVLISKLLIYLALIIIKQIRSDSDGKITKKRLLAFIILPLSTLLVAMYSAELIELASELVKIFVTIGLIFLVFSNFLFLYLYESQMIENEENRKQELINMHLNDMQNHYKELINKYKITNKRFHDIDNKLIVISGMITGNDMVKKEHIEEINELIKDTQGIKFTEIDGLDALLNNKLTKMREKSIVFRQRIYISPEINLNEMSLCLLIGNLLDNAIEACERVENKSEIHLNLKQNEHQLYILVQNDCLDGKINGKTSKQDKYKHGYGIEIIEEIVNSHGGNIIKKQENGKYEVIITLEI